MDQNNKEDSPKEEELVLSLDWNFSTLLNTFFLYFLSIPKKDFINNLNNITTYYTIIGKILKTVQWKKNRWYGIMINTNIIRDNIINKT